MDEMTLRKRIGSLDGKGYGAYKSLAGRYALPMAGGDVFTLFIDHVQADPYAPPSRMRVRVPMRAAQLPPELVSTDTRRVAMEDILARSVRQAALTLVREGHVKEVRGREENGVRYGGAGVPAGRASFFIDAGGQEILPRSAVKIAPGADGFVEARVSLSLPAAGRRILAKQCARLLLEVLPQAVSKGLVWRNVDQSLARKWVAQCEDQEFIRVRLAEKGLVAFVGDGSILPRESGVSDRPLALPRAVRFWSPESLKVEFVTPNAGPVRGMGIPQGVTLIVGGGYHGKSTLLRALERGVYPHIPGDGREWVVTDPTAVKIRAEDGRSVAGVNISSFIRDLPGGVSTCSFDSLSASGSTSQAANIVEAIESGATVLLLDEDTCATNFMVRDLRMETLMRRREEPIIPFIDRVKQLHRELGISSILVMGGCGDYFEVADTVILMQEYRPYDVTDEAKRIAREVPGRRFDGAVRPAARTSRAFDQREPEPDRQCSGLAAALRTTRYVDLGSLREAAGAGRSGGKPRVRVRGRKTLLLGRSALDLWGLEQLVDPSQTRAIGCALALLASAAPGIGPDAGEDRITMERALGLIEGTLAREGVDGLSPFPKGEHPGDLAWFRRMELAAALNRLRGLSAIEVPDAEEGEEEEE